MDEVEAIVELEIELEINPKVWRGILDKIERREITLSFSKIKAFADSPFNFMRYMIARELKEDKGTPAMVFGDLVDCLILTPDEVASRFIIEPEGGVLNSIKGADTLLDFYSVTAEGDKLADKKAAIQAAREATGKRIIEPDSLKKAKAIRDRVYFNQASGWVMSNITATQVNTEFTAFDWDWRGKIDGEGAGLIMDLKKVVSASPRRAETTIKDMRYNWQGALYTLPRGNKDFYNVCVDASLGVSVWNIDRKSLSAAWFEIEEMVSHFERCIFLGMDNPGIWYSSYDFFAHRRGIFQYNR